LTIRTLIVDDEPPARNKIRTFLESEEDFEVVGECGSGTEAVAAIEDSAPDLVFLDVQMPGADGFAVIETVGAAQMPATVFVTAFDQYAVKAFDFHAVDYLLKPFDRARFREALAQICSQLERSDASRLNQQLSLLLEDLKRAETYSERLAVKTTSGVGFLKTDEIHWVDAAGNYVRLNTGNGEAHLLRETLTALARRLDPNRFVRVHRSTIVNVEHIRELRAQTHGEHLIIMESGQRLTLSRGYRDRVHDLILRP
jgi:two-component system LytT family response regulator